MRTRYLYVMSSELGTKVGKCTCPIGRTRQLKYDTGSEHQIEAVFDLKNIAAVHFGERDLLNSLAEYNIQGEYFSISPDEAIEAANELGFEVCPVPPERQRQRAFRFTDDELKLLDALKDKYGSYKAGVMAAARTHLKRAEPSKEEIIELVKNRLK